MRSVTVTTLLATLATTFVAAPAMAETITNRTMQVSVDVPERWKSESSGESITLTDKHEDIAVVFTAIDSGAVKAATKAARRALGAKIKNLTFKKEESVTINGMEGIGFGGDGIMDGKDIDLMVLVLDTPNEDKDLLIIAVGEDAKVAKHHDEVEYVFSHLKPLH